ncbi:glutamyl-tRNA reductase [Opitutus terrae]|uniref:Glutamyl-tRNA reductase n=1 Tax=Opitutus terrae (strain DSM 11246 / JCM 15787 / PB90-1) TaxID=452637 RepID=B1ZMU3_OPITP|nr:glutamyl-tRNA reductase [Opitutus terrae]ACB75371.1 glutamyl-tRNA reductase [Opitutus terrae PB90-1]
MSADGFFVIGATHHTAPLAVRERLSLNADAAAAFATEVRRWPELREFTLLNTCNRIEFYGVASDAAIAERVQATFCTRQNFDPVEFAQFRLQLTGLPAVQHLLEVAAGIDSQMLGENEIFGQVKEAYATAQTSGHTGPVLNRVFQKTFQAAKHVRTHTAITGGQVSIANVAVDLAGSIFGKLDQTRILLLGAGEIGEKTAKAFRSRGAGSLTVASRSLDRAMALASALEASAMPFDQREARLAEFDVVVCATSAPTTVISPAAAEAALAKRPARPLFFIDLALPRDVDTHVTELENVFLYNLDDLAKIADENRAAREAEIAKCRAILNEKAAALWQHIAPKIG